MKVWQPISSMWEKRALWKPGPFHLKRKRIPTTATPIPSLIGKIELEKPFWINPWEKKRVLQSFSNFILDRKKSITEAMASPSMTEKIGHYKSHAYSILERKRAQQNQCFFHPWKKKMSTTNDMTIPSLREKRVKEFSHKRYSWLTLSDECPNSVILLQEDENKNNTGDPADSTLEYKIQSKTYHFSSEAQIQHKIIQYL